jgi:hypothetical protein
VLAAQVQVPLTALTLLLARMGQILCLGHLLLLPLLAVAGLVHIRSLLRVYRGLLAVRVAVAAVKMVVLLTLAALVIVQQLPQAKVTMVETDKVQQATLTEPAAVAVLLKQGKML